MSATVVPSSRHAPRIPTRSWASLRRTARAPIGVLLLAAIGLAVPPQLGDMVAFLDDRAILPTLAFQGALALLALSVWYWSRAALAARFGVGDSQAERQKAFAAQPDLDPTAYEWLPRALFLATVLLGLVLLWRGGWSWPNAAYLLLWGSAGCVFLVARQNTRLAARTVSTGPGVAHTVHPYGTRAHALVRHAPHGIQVGLPMLAFSFTLFVLCAAASFNPSNNDVPRISAVLARWFPGPSVAVLALAMMIGPLTLLSFVADKHNLQVAVPIGAKGNRLRIGPRRPPLIILALLYIFVLVPLTTHLHTIRVTGDPTEVAKRATLQVAFNTWTRDCYGDHPPATLRPVIVAVSGGATRAGVWAASVLDQVTQSARAGGPALFAVSSVSGGSLGTGAAMALYAMRSAHGQPLCQVPDANALQPLHPIGSNDGGPLSGDALGPLLAGWMFNDIPRAIFAPAAALLRAAAPWRHALQPRGGDSAAAIEQGFADLWQTVAHRIGAPDFDQPYLSLFYTPQGALRPGMPLWFANGTDAKTGTRLITAPIAPADGCPATPAANPGAMAGVRAPPSRGTGNDASSCWPFHAGGDLLGRLNSDVRIATAINNTARFPYLEPFGEVLPLAISQHDAQTVRAQGSLIDGGYFENEGLQTALDLADWLIAHPPSGVGTVQPIIVEATADGDAKVHGVTMCGTDLPISAGPAQDRSVMLQILAPVLGLYNVRSGHSAVLLQQAHAQLCPDRFLHFYFPAYGQESIPMNWLLSRRLSRFAWNGAFCDGTVVRNATEQRALQCIMQGNGPCHATSAADPASAPLLRCPGTPDPSRVAAAQGAAPASP